VSDWKFRPHGPLEQLAENLWRVEALLGDGPLHRVMTVARRSDGGLVVHSAIALEPAAMDALDLLGPVAYLLIPNAFHRIDAPRYKARYPAVRVFCPPGARKGVEKRVPVDGTYPEFPVDRDVSLSLVDGVRDGEGLMTVRSRDGVTLVFNDLVFNMPHAGGFPGFMVRHVMRSSGGPRVSRLARVALVKDARRARAALEALADTPGLVRVIVSHHELIRERPGDALRLAASTL